MNESSDEPGEPGETAGHVAPGVKALGDFIKSQRRLAELSQRELARLADLSDAYLSQVERGLHEPSVRVLSGLAQALNVPSDRLLRYLGRDRDSDAHEQLSTELVISTDDRLSDHQKQSLIDVYRAFISANDAVRPHERTTNDTR
jgi:transcriptional regulator with XRE-family HTH domain